jgi:DNA polymerase-4
LRRSECEHVFVSGEASVLHADLDSFYASVEQRDAARLRGRPVIVGSWVVLAASYEAKAHGVQGGMGGSEARRRCPQAIVVRPRMAAYSEASKAVFEIFEQTSPVVEPLSIDEAFLDTRGMEAVFGTPREIAVRLRREVRQRVGLPITVGVARTKFLAKVASAVAKPDGLLVVPPGEELGFLHPLRIEYLWGVGPVTSRKLRAVGLTTVRDVAQADEGALIELLGPAAGRHIHALAHNRDPRRVRGRRRRTMGSQRALGRRAPKSADEIDATVVAIVDRLARRLRAARRVCRTVTLRLRFDDYSRATRANTLSEATAQTQVILSTSRKLLAGAMPIIERQGLTLIGVALGNLDDDSAIQLALPLEDHRSAALDVALDSLRERYGAEVITRAVLLGRATDPGVPLLPD